MSQAVHDTSDIVAGTRGKGQGKVEEGRAEGPGGEEGQGRVRAGEGAVVADQF